MTLPTGNHQVNDIPGLLANFEARLNRIEKYLGVEARDTPSSVHKEDDPPSASATTSHVELEFHVGQNWFAKIGIVILTVGVIFTLSLPLPDLPAVGPSVIGFALALVMFLFSRLWRRSFEMVSRYMRWSGMALLYFAVLRLCYFGVEPLLQPSSLPSAALLLAVVAFNFWVGFRRQSPYLVTMALLLGMLTALAVGEAWFVLIVITLLCGILSYQRIRFDWVAVFLVHIPLVFITYLMWALNNPLISKELKLLSEPFAAPWFLLAYGVILAAASFWRQKRSEEDLTTVGSAVLICGFSYLIFLLQTLRASTTVFTVSQVAVALVYLGLATAFWLRERSRGATFIYAITGYAAISLAIIRAVTTPEVFLWLSLLSLFVITTAVWFRSRFIVMANFVIFLVTIACYVFTVTNETGISLGFGLAAIVSARILNWQKERIELETHFLRNAYLLLAFFLFPYATAHLVPEAFIALSWAGIAAVYYVLNLIINNPKYRWMGHGTLVLAVLYIVVAGIGQLEPVYRNVSYLVLGSMLLLVSLIFTKVHAQQHKAEKEVSTE